MATALPNHSAEGCNLTMYTGKQLGEAIDSARKLKKMSKKALADYFGVKPPSVQDWVNKGTIDKEKLSRLWELFADVVGPEHWGIGEPDRGPSWGSWGGPSETIAMEHAPKFLAMDTESEDDFTIPAYRSGDRGSYLDLSAGSGQIKSLTVTHQWLRTHVTQISDLGNLRIVTGFNTVMRPMFNPGDPLLVDIGVNHVESEGVYLFKLNGEAFIKIIQRVPVHNQQTHRLRIVSKNPDFLPIEIAASESGFEVIGKILTVWKSEQF